ncbi:TlpA disulfide reductase family protein [Chitinophaga sp.]|uniref:TlpA disulfide reductase family protein n=1 Tax=Chitinophaga sp. TaxID=1869181 RepID=UPI0031DF2F86
MRLLLALLLFPAFVFAQKGDYKLEGKMTNWKGTDSLTYAFDSKRDTIVVHDGKFSLKFNLEQPTLMYIRKLDYAHEKQTPDVTKLYLEKGTVMITGTDSLKYAKIKGGPVNTVYEERSNVVIPLNKHMMELRLAIEKYPKGPQRDSFAKTVKDDYVATQDSIIAYLLSFVKAHSHSFIALQTISEMSGPAVDYQKYNPLYVALDEPLKKTPLGKAFGERLAIARNLAPGAKAPAFTSTDLKGDSLALYTVLKQGKVTLVDFWASWCGPCRAENPNVVKAYNTYHEKGFNILSVSLDDKHEKWEAAIAKDGMPWYHVSSLKGWQEPVALLYDIHAVPDNLLLDSNGKVIARGLRGAALAEKLAGLLK